MTIMNILRKKCLTSIVKICVKQDVVDETDPEEIIDISEDAATHAVLSDEFSDNNIKVWH